MDMAFPVWSLLASTQTRQRRVRSDGLSARGDSTSKIPALGETAFLLRQRHRQSLRAPALASPHHPHGYSGYWMTGFNDPKAIYKMDRRRLLQNL